MESSAYCPHCPPTRPLLLSKNSSTDARPTGARSPAPLKMTSCIDSPRSADARDSPSTQRTASMTFDLPQPLGPTMPTSCPGVAMVTGSTNDLKPASLISVRRNSDSSGNGCSTGGVAWSQRRDCGRHGAALKQTPGKRRCSGCDYSRFVWRIRVQRPVRQTDSQGSSADRRHRGQAPFLDGVAGGLADGTGHGPNRLEQRHLTSAALVCMRTPRVERATCGRI